MARQLEDLSIDYEFFRAIDGAAGEHLNFPNCIGDRPGRSGKRLIAGESGCFASHFLVWKQAISAGEKVVVLEDDNVLHPEILDALSIAEKALDDWPFVRLCGLVPQPSVTLAESGGYRLVRYLRGPVGCQAYALSPDGARRLVAKAARWTEPVDLYLDRFWFHGVPCLGLLPYRVTLAPTPSDIGERAAYVRGDKYRRMMSDIPDELRRRAWNLRHMPGQTYERS
jgi:glycosyl transferase family 25